MVRLGRAVLSASSIAAVAAVGPSDVQKRLACCAMHDDCQLLAPGVPHPSACQEGYRFSVRGAHFQVEQADFPDQKHNNYLLAMEGAEAEPFPCNCSDVGAWICRDPTTRHKRGLMCGAALTASAGAQAQPALAQGPSDAQKRQACCTMHDDCQLLAPGVPHPSACQVGYRFSARGARFKVEQADFPDQKHNNYLLAMEGAEAEPFSCNCSDVGAWICRDPTTERKRGLMCGAALKVSEGGAQAQPASGAAAVSREPSDDQQRAACCTMHDKCQGLAPDAHIPEECKVGYSFSVAGGTFHVDEAEYPEPDSNHYFLSMDGAEAAPFPCSCFDHGRWICSDPTDRRRELACSGGPALSMNLTREVFV